MKDGKGNEIADKIIKKMTEYTQFHFDTEEKYFDMFKYEFSAQHKAEHDAFVEKVLDFQIGFEKSQANLSIEIMNFLKDWLLNHIRGSDKKYTNCFNEHGLK
jgi:hemerythrin